MLSELDEVREAQDRIVEYEQAYTIARDELEAGETELQDIFETRTFLREPSFPFGSSLFENETDDADYIYQISVDHVITKIEACAN